MAAAIHDGASRSEAARIGAVTLQIVRDWVLRFNAHGPDGLKDRKAPGQPRKLDAQQRAAGSPRLVVQDFMMSHVLGRHARSTMTPSQRRSVGH